MFIPKIIRDTLMHSVGKMRTFGVNPDGTCSWHYALKCPLQHGIEVADYFRTRMHFPRVTASSVPVEYEAEPRSRSVP